MCIFFRRKNKENLKNFVKENNINLSEEELNKLLDTVVLYKNINYKVIKDSKEFEKLLYEKLALDEEFRKYLELEYNNPYAKAPFNVVPYVPNSFVYKTIVEEKLDVVIGEDLKKGIMHANSKEKIEPYFDKNSKYVIVRYEKIYRWENSNVIANPTLYFYNF